jgi:hypothetical protein
LIKADRNCSAFFVTGPKSDVFRHDFCHVFCKKYNKIYKIMRKFLCISTLQR